MGFIHYEINTPAWKSINEEIEWGAESLAKYQNFVRTSINSINSAMDCADLALTLLVRFAHKEKRRLVVQKLDSSHYGFSPGFFEARVRRSIGSTHFPNITFQTTGWGPGDLLVYPPHPTYGHVRVLFDRHENDKVGYYSGDLPAIIPVYRIEDYSKLILNAVNNAPRRFNQFK